MYIAFRFLLPLRFSLSIPCLHVSRNDSFPGRRALKLSSKEYIALGPIHLLVSAMVRLWGKKVLIRPVAVVLVGMGIYSFYSASPTFSACAGLPWPAWLAVLPLGPLIFSGASSRKKCVHD